MVKMLQQNEFNIMKIIIKTENLLKTKMNQIINNYVVET